MQNITNLARTFRNAIEISDIEEILPFFSSFPWNCCEHTAVLFGFYSKLIYPNLKVEVIRGCSDSINGIEYHLWLELNNRIFDLTIDQFDGYSEPIYCAKNNPISDEFIEDKRILIYEYMDYYFEKVLERPRFTRALLEIVSKLKELGWNSHNKTFKGMRNA